MLKPETIKQIAGFLKIKESDFTAAIKDEKEVDLSIDSSLQVYTSDEVTTLKNNEYNSGKVKGVEMAVKETKEKLGIEFTGKTIDGLVTAATAKAIADAKIEPDKQVRDMQEKLATVQNSYKQLEIQFKEKEGEVETTKIKSEVFKHIPTFGENSPALGQDEVLSLMKANGYDFKNENGKVVTYKDGKQVIDKVSNPLEVKDVVTGFLKEKKLVGEEHTPAGRGGGSGKPAGNYATLSEMKKDYESRGISLQGAEFSQAVQKAVAANKEFAMDK